MRTILKVLIAVIAVLSFVQQAAAQSAEEKADFELVQSMGTRRAYQVFLGIHPKGHYADVVRKQLQEMDLQDRRLEPNWGDGMFIDRLMQKQR